MIKNGVYEPIYALEFEGLLYKMLSEEPFKNHKINKWSEYIIFNIRIFVFLV